MFPATNMSGVALGAPDVCITPTAAGPVPIAYPNSGNWATAVGTIPTVLIECRPTVVISSRIPMSVGNEPGTGGGVVSGINKGPIAPTQGSAKVFVANQPLVLHGGATAHNGANANVPGQNVVPSQAKVFASP